MSSRASQFLNVAIAAVAAALIVVGLTLDTRTTPKQPPVQPGKPPVPTGLTGTVGKEITEAFREWPHGSIDTLQKLGLRYQGGPTAADKETGAMVQYFRGVALLWAGYPSDAQAALVSARKLGQNTLFQSRADGLLHPNYFRPTTGPWYPVFQPVSNNPLLLDGAKLQNEGHQESAEKLFDKAVKRDPNDPEALTAQAVGLFTENNPAPAFGKLGPLTQRFPRSQIVHFEMGWLLLWSGDRAPGVSQFKKVIALGAHTSLGQQAQRLVSAIDAQASSPPASSSSG